MISFIIY